MKLVKIIRALQANDIICDLITELTSAIGKTPRVSKGSYGFVVNRFLIPVIGEAVNGVYGVLLHRRMPS